MYRWKGTGDLVIFIAVYDYGAAQALEAPNG